MNHKNTITAIRSEAETLEDPQFKAGMLRACEMVEEAMHSPATQPAIWLNVVGGRVIAHSLAEVDAPGWQKYCVAGSSQGYVDAAQDVLAERRRQVEQEGYDTEHDDGHVNGEIAAYAAFYAMPPAVREWPATETGYGDDWANAIVPHGWPVPPDGDRRRELVKAGALILAEIERIDRAAVRQVGNKEAQ